MMPNPVSVKSVALGAARSRPRAPAAGTAAAAHAVEADARFTRIVEQHSDLVVNTCHHFLRDADEAHDVAQEVFLVALGNLDRITDDAGWRAWLYRTASHRSLNALRARRRRAWLRPFGSMRRDGIDPNNVAAPGNVQPDSDIERDDLRRALDSAIDSLPSRQRTAFVLHRYEELSHGEIAAVMLVHVKAVDGLLHRARVHLQKQLAKHYREFRNR
jgi:RNA polymerase sigma-70 factor (ECF subfamily)